MKINSINSTYSPAHRGYVSSGFKEHLHNIAELAKKQETEVSSHLSRPVNNEVIEKIDNLKNEIIEIFSNKMKLFHKDTGLYPKEDLGYQLYNYKTDTSLSWRDYDGMNTRLRPYISDRAGDWFTPVYTEAKEVNLVTYLENLKSVAEEFGDGHFKPNAKTADKALFMKRLEHEYARAKYFWVTKGQIQDAINRLRNISQEFGVDPKSIK